MRIRLSSFSVWSPSGSRSPPGCRLPAPYAVPSLPGLTVPDRVSVRSGGRVVSVPLEEYVTGSVLAEVTPINETPDVVARIYEVQAVVARTYVVAHRGRHRADGFDVCDTTHCQLYDPARLRRRGSARRPVPRSGARPVRSSATAGARRTRSTTPTAAARPPTPAASGADAPCPICRAWRTTCRRRSHRAWTFTATSETVLAALNRDPRTAVGARLSNIDVLLRDPSGRATSVVLRGERERIVRGEDLRAVLNRTVGDRGRPEHQVQRDPQRPGRIASMAPGSVTASASVRPAPPRARGAERGSPTFCGPTSKTPLLARR